MIRHVILAAIEIDPDEPATDRPPLLLPTESGVAASEASTIIDD